MKILCDFPEPKTGTILAECEFEPQEDKFRFFRSLLYDPALENNYFQSENDETEIDFKSRAAGER